jgi:hypothetical protein
MRLLPCAACAFASLASVLAGQPQPRVPADERPALAALAEPTPPSAFPIEVNPVSVPTPGHPGQLVLFVRVQGSDLQFAANPKTGMFTAGAVMVARFLDQAGTVVRHASQEVPFRGLLADAKTILARPVEFAPRVDLAPGRHRIEVVVYDSGGKKASVVKIPYEAPPVDAPVVGSLMILDRAERLPADQPEDPSDPFILEHVLMHPSYDSGVNRAVHPALNFVLPLVLQPGATAPPATLALLKDGQTLAAVPLTLGVADAAGKLTAVGHLPLAKVSPGAYQLRVTIGSGPDARVRTTGLTVVD